jgi:tetratricopeptide (TPR) repeat protein
MRGSQLLERLVWRFVCASLPVLVLLTALTVPEEWFSSGWGPMVVLREVRSAAYTTMGLLAELGGDREGALRWYGRLPGDGEALPRTQALVTWVMSERAAAELERGAREAAILSLRAIGRRRVLQAEEALGLAMALGAGGELVEAERWLRAAGRLDPLSPLPWVARFGMLLLAGRQSAALEAFHGALAAHREEGLLWLNWAAGRCWAGDRAGAAEALARAWASLGGGPLAALGVGGADRCLESLEQEGVARSGAESQGSGEGGAWPRELLFGLQERLRGGRG